MKYRCAKCRHGRNLKAITHSHTEGDLNPDEGGELLTHDWTEECYVIEETIRCTVHGDAVTIHRQREDGVWCRWVPCPSQYCMSGTRYEYLSSLGRYAGSGRRIRCEVCCGAGGAWLPLRERIFPERAVVEAMR